MVFLQSSTSVRSGFPLATLPVCSRAVFSPCLPCWRSLLLLFSHGILSGPSCWPSLFHKPRSGSLPFPSPIPALFPYSHISIWIHGELLIIHNFRIL